MLTIIPAKAAQASLEPTRQRRWQSWKRFSARRLSLVGVVIVGLVLLIALAAPLLAPHDPAAQSISGRLTPPFTTPVNGDGISILGTDHLGRDILSRLIYGSRISLLVGFTAVALGGTLGLLFGLFAGFYRGPLDSVIMRLADLQLAFPLILLALVVVALLGPSLRNVIIVFALTSWPIYARVVRASVLSIREKEYVEAARALGSRNSRILSRHVLPNVVAPLTVIASFEIARMIILESALGFLGLSVQPPTPTWGNMLADGRGYIDTSWWIAAFPGLFITLTVAGINFVGDGVRDAFAPD